MKKEELISNIQTTLTEGRSLLSDLHGEWAIPATIKLLLEKFAAMNAPEFYFQVYSLDNKNIVVQLRDLYQRIPQQLADTVLTTETTVKVEEVVVKKTPTNYQLRIMSCIGLNRSGVPASFLKPLLKRTSDPKTILTQPINDGLVTINRVRGVNIYTITDKGQEAITDTPCQYDFLGYVKWFSSTHPKVEREWDLLTKLLIEGTHLKARCPVKSGTMAIYKTGLFEDMEDRSDQSIQLSKFGRWFRTNYLKQLDEVTRP